MTLAEWLLENPDMRYEKWITCVVVRSDKHSRYPWELWNLSDYTVSSVISGPAVVLVPRWK